MNKLESYVRSLIREAIFDDVPKTLSKFDYERAASDILQKFGRTSDKGWERVAVRQFVESQKTYDKTGPEWDEAKLIKMIGEMHDEYMGVISDKNVARIY